MSSINSDSISLTIRVYPIDEPKGSTVAFAGIAIDDLAAIRGIRVVDSEAKGLFVSMPQSRDNSGLYHDVAFPLNGDLRKEINAAVLDEYSRQTSLLPGQRGYEKAETDPDANWRREDAKIDAKVFPIAEPKGNTLAFASIALDDTIAIRGIRVVNSDKGLFVSMPRTYDKHKDQHHDIAFPLSGDVRKAVSKTVLAEYQQAVDRRKQSLGERLTGGREHVAQQAASVPRRSAAKKSPGLE